MISIKITNLCGEEIWNQVIPDLISLSGICDNVFKFIDSRKVYIMGVFPIISYVNLKQTY